MEKKLNKESKEATSLQAQVNKLDTSLKELQHQLRDRVEQGSVFSLALGSSRKGGGDREGEEWKENVVGDSIKYYSSHFVHAKKINLTRAQKKSTLSL